MRPLRSSTATKPRRRSLRPRVARATLDMPAAPPVVTGGDEHAAVLQRRIRESGGPEDHALYACTCGYAFEADVQAGVPCPHCGTEQTW